MKARFLVTMAGAFCSLSLFAQTQNLSARIEPLLGFSSTEKGVQLQVASSGCTSAESFEIDKYTYKKTIRIMFIRVVPDTCPGLLEKGQSIGYSFESLGLKAGDRFQIMNQIQVQ